MYRVFGSGVIEYVFFFSCVRQHTPRIPALERLRLKVLECEATQGFPVRSCLRKQADNIHICQELGKPQVLTTLQRQWLGFEQDPGAPSCIQISVWPRDLKASEKKSKAVGRKRHSEGDS